MRLKNNFCEISINKISAPLTTETYDFIYDFENYKEEEFKNILDINIVLKGKNVRLALYCDYCGNYETCTVLNGDKLIVVMFSTVYEINTLNGEARYLFLNDLAGAYGVYKVDDGYIIHGEMYVVKIDHDLSIIWTFFGKDIFASPDGKDAFTIYKDRIELIDFENNRYTINLNGELLQQIMINNVKYNSFKKITENPIILDFSKCKYPHNIHFILKEKFGLPEYYGENWDALWDCIQYLFEDETCVEIHNFYSSKIELQDYCKPLFTIFDDIHEENPSFTYKIIS